MGPKNADPTRQQIIGLPALSGGRERENLPRRNAKNTKKVPSYSLSLYYYHSNHPHASKISFTTT